MVQQRADPCNRLAAPRQTSAPAEPRWLQPLAPDDTTAFWAIWEQYRDSLLARRCFQWMGGHREDAEDALSSASLKIWQAWPAHADEVRSVPAWLTRLRHNHCIDMRRDRARHRRTEQLVEDMGALEAGAGAQTQSSLEEVALQHEQGMLLWHALNHLPPLLREPALLRFYHELPHRDIAAQLSLTPETVRKRVQQARIILQRQWHAYLAGAQAPCVNDVPRSRVRHRRGSPGVTRPKRLRRAEGNCMNAVSDAGEQTPFGTTIATPRAPTSITTTLYELMAALQSVGEPDEDELIVAIVALWVYTGRITFCGSSTR